MSSALRELLAAFSVKVDLEEVKEADKRIDAFAQKLEAVGAMVAVAFAGSKLVGFLSGLADIGVQLKSTADRLGTTTGELQAFRFAGAEVGVGAEQMDTALTFLNKSMGKAEEGSKLTSRAFASLGINANSATTKAESLPELLGDVAEGFSKITDRGKRTATAAELFGRAGARLIPLLSKGRAGVAELTAQFKTLGGGFTTDFIGKADDANKATVRFGAVLDGLKSSIGSALLPVFTEMADGIDNIVAKVRDWTDHTNILSTALEFIGGGIILGGLAKLVATFVELDAAAAIASLEMIIGFGVALLAVGALYLVFDELVTLFSGGSTIIGDLLDRMNGFGGKEVFIQQIKDAWQALCVVFADAWGTVQDLTSSFGGAMPLAIKAAVVAMQLLGVAVASVVTALTAAYHLTAALGDLSDKDFAGASKHWEAVKSAGGHWMDAMGALAPDKPTQEQQEALVPGSPGWEGARNAPSNADGPNWAPTVGVHAPAFTRPSAPSNNGPTVVHQHVEATVNVHGVKGDPDQVGSTVNRAVTDGLQRALRDARAAL